MITNSTPRPRALALPMCLVAVTGLLVTGCQRQVQTTTPTAPPTEEAKRLAPSAQPVPYSTTRPAPRSSEPQPPQPQASSARQPGGARSSTASAGGAGGIGAANSGASGNATSAASSTAEAARRKTASAAKSAQPSAAPQTSTSRDTRAAHTTPPSPTAPPFEEAGSKPPKMVPPSAADDPLARLERDPRTDHGSSASASVAERRQAKDLTDPTLPDLPSQPRQTELVSPTTRLVALRGAWVQSHSDPAADYSLGGYSERILVFKDPHPSLQVVSAFGSDHATRVSETLVYELTEDGRIKISRPPSADGSAALLPAGASHHAQGVVALAWSVDGQQLRLGPKTFDRMELQDARRFLAGGPLNRSDRPGAAAPRSSLLPAQGDHLAVILLASPGASSEIWRTACTTLRNELLQLGPTRQACVRGASTTESVRWSAGPSPDVAIAIALSESAGSPPTTPVQIQRALSALSPRPDAILLLVDQRNDIKDFAAVLRDRASGIPCHVVCVQPADVDAWRQAMPTASVRTVR